MRFFRSTGLALVIVASGFAADASAKAKKKTVEVKVESPTELQKNARARMKQLDYEAAVVLLQKLKSHPDADARLKAEALLDLGICELNLGDSTGARASFLAALDLDATLSLASSAPPAVQKLFLAAHDERFPPAPPPTPTPDVPVDRSIAPPPTAVAADPAAPPEVAVAPPEQSSGLMLPIILAGGAAVGLGVGIATGLQSASAAAKIQSGLHTGAEVEALRSTQSTMSMVSIVGYVAAGVCGAGAITAFIISRNSSTPVAVSVIVAPDGAMASASLQF